MKPWPHIKHSLAHWNDWKGRADLVEYGWFAGLASLATLPLALVLLAWMGVEAASLAGTAVSPVVRQALALIGVIGLGLAVPVLVVSFSVTVRRLNDTGRSRWWALSLLPLGAGTLAFLAMGMAGSQAQNLALALAGLILGLAFGLTWFGMFWTAAVLAVLPGKGATLDEMTNSAQ